MFKLKARSRLKRVLELKKTHRQVPVYKGDVLINYLWIKK